MQRALAALLLVLALWPAGLAFAQSREADQALEDLIPDSALDDPKKWAQDTDAAKAPVPDPEVLLAPNATQPLTGIPEIKLAWPDAAELPPIAPLTPDADIAQAAEQAKAVRDALSAEAEGGSDPGSGRGYGQIPGASLIPVTPQLMLAFPPEVETLPERELVAMRFGALASLRKFGNEEDNLAQLTRRARQDIDLLQRVLRIYGYYDAEVTQSTTGYAAPAEGSGPAPTIDLRKVGVRFDIRPGPRYALSRISLGDIAAAFDSAALARAFALSPGDPVNTDRIVAEREHLIAALGEGGHAFAQVGEPDLAVDHAARTGDLTVPVSSGGQYVIGAIHSSLPDYLSSRHLARMARFRTGDPFRLSRVDDLRQAILATGLVSAVTVTPLETAPAAGAKPGVADIDVTLAKAPQRTIAGLVGYSSGEGLRVEASWENRNMFPPEGLVRFRGVVGTREQLAGATYRRNNFFGRDQVLTGDLYAQTRRTDAYSARTLSFQTTFEKQTTLIFQKAWLWSAGFELLATSELPAAAGSTRTTYFIGALPLRMAYDGSNDLLDPRRGLRVSVRLSPEISVQNGMRSNYVRAQLDASAYQPVTGSVVLAERVRLGTIPGTDVGRIAPSRRFYAGGGASVRGFAYQAVGPRDALGNPSGGRSLSEFSLEARVKTKLMGGAVSLVPFVDAGTVGTTASPTISGLKVGVGLGLRYQTSFGPIRIDLGTPLNPAKGDSRVGVYVSLGQAF
ncbi:MAG: BamA/TamA family outer membrane protein [Novosphingobium sp.]|uniref:autotransporter assembly complex protein TamA n=1 Tax=Novosphingobium sp. TaxID=1874826 RepID=UPI00301AFA07